MTIKQYVTSVLLLMLIGVCPAYAAIDVENAHLARIKQVLASLDSLIQAAEREQEQSDRIKFHYEWLREDISKIQQGIDEKLKQSPLEPRRIEPLRGDYIKKSRP
jgi:RAQPRD family integrative conjugative element protein